MRSSTVAGRTGAVVTVLLFGSATLSTAGASESEGFAAKLAKARTDVSNAAANCGPDDSCQREFCSAFFDRLPDKGVKFNHDDLLSCIRTLTRDMQALREWFEVPTRKLNSTSHLDQCEVPLHLSGVRNPNLKPGEKPAPLPDDGAGVQAGTEERRCAYVVGDLDEYLLTQRSRYKHLKLWLQRVADKTTRHALDPMQEPLYQLLNDRGLRRPFSAELLAGVALEDAGGGAGSSKDKAPSAHVRWHSRHVGLINKDDEDNRVDYGLTGRFGLQPALTLVKSQATVDATSARLKGATPMPDPSPSPDAQYQTAFVFDTAAELHRHISGQGEIVAFGAANIVHLTKNVDVRENGKTAEILVPLSSESGQTAWNFEYGLGFSIYDKADDRRAEMIHDLRGVDPAFEASIAFRHDNRFSKTKDLVNIDSPEQRIVARVFLNVPVSDRRNNDAAGSGKLLRLSIGMEHEFARKRGGAHVPAATKFLLRGDLDLIKALHGGN